MSTRSKKGRNHAAVDNWLDSIGLYRKNVAYDETCLFRAVSEQCQIYHERVRIDCVNYGRMHYDEFWHLLDADQWFDHLDLLEKHMVVCGNLEIQILSCKYNCDVIVYDALHQEVTNVTKRGYDNILTLCLMQEDHYDVVYDKEHIQNAGFCQSLVYNILYENVFDIPNVQDIVKGMLYEKEFVSLSFAEINNNNELIKAEKASDCSDESLIPAMNIAPFPFKVAKALDPTIYRNIEYDSWTEVRRELRLGDWYYGDDNLILGTRCILNLDDERTFECYIQEIIKDENKCVVYVTKLAEKRTVNYTDLSPENDAKPWPLPYRFTKNLATSPAPPASENKFLKAPKKRKDKRRAKSNSESQTKQLEAFIGVPLQIQENRAPNQNETPPETSLSQHNLLVTPEVASPLPKFSWDAPWANNPVSPEKCWPQTPNFCNSFNVKPMVASAPVTPNIIPYHDNQMPFVYNYHVDNYSTWATNDSNPNQYVDLEDTKEIKVEPQGSPSPQTQAYTEHYERPVREHPTLILPPPNSQPVEMYSPVINIQPGTPVIYTHEEMVVPAPQYQVYTPPVQYMSPTPYFYSPTIQTAWYPLDVNSQGFIFPTPVNQNVQSN